VTIDECRPGQRVRVVQTIERRERDWRGAVVGVIQAVALEKTGSWYAHSKDDKLWLRRVRLVKDDGEVAVLTVDALTEIEVLDGAETGQSSANGGHEAQR
jgi:hypothetical protein